MQFIQIKDFPNYYVSDSGIIYSKHRSGYVELKPWTVCGYKQVCLSKNNKKHHKFIHRIVAERQTGINSGNIRMCCLGKRLSAGNYQWKYK